MANPRARPHSNPADTEHYLPQCPPSWLQPSICTQPDFQSLNGSLDLLSMVNQHLRRHPFHTEPMPSQTYFQDQRAYNLLYRLRGDLILLDRLIDDLSQARRLLQFVTTGPGLPGQYRINPTATLSSRNLAIIHNIPPGFPLPPGLSSRSPSPSPRTHHKTQPACTHTGQALHHKPPRQPTPTLLLTLGNVHGPATASHTTWANYSNIQPPALRQPPRILPTMRQHPCPRLLLLLFFKSH